MIIKFIAINEGCGIDVGDIMITGGLYSSNGAVYHPLNRDYPKFEYGDLEASPDFEEYVELWEPEEGEVFFTLGVDGGSVDPMEFQWESNDEFDRERIEGNVVFRKLEDRDKAIEGIKALLKTASLASRKLTEGENK